MLKIIGLIGLTLSIGMIGIMKSWQLSRRVELLEDYLKMVIEMKAQINYFREPLPQLFDKIAKDSDSKALSLVKDVELSIDEKSAEISQIWAQKVRERYMKDPVNTEDLKLFVYLGEFVGQTDYENQLFHFTYLEEHLKEQINKGVRDVRVRGPLMRKIGFLVGAIISIVLI